MQRILSFGGQVFALATLAASLGCSTNVQVGNDGSGGSGGQASGTMTGPGGGQSTSTSTASGGAGSGSGGGDVSGLGGPCGGNLMSPPKHCAAGLHCVHGNLDAVGTCAETGQTVSGVGDPCGGTVHNPPPICAWNLQCQTNGNPDTGGTCVDPNGCQGVITINGENIPPLDYACKGSYGAAYTTRANGHVGYQMPHDTNPEQVWVDGCNQPNGEPQSGSISIQAPQAVVGTAHSGQMTYYAGTDVYANANDSDVTLTITSIDPTTIKGTYSAHLQSVNNGVRDIAGTFSVCHVSDFFPP
jgi:hypothetical protein